MDTQLGAFASSQSQHVARSSRVAALNSKSKGMSSRTKATHITHVNTDSTPACMSGHPSSILRILQRHTIHAAGHASRRLPCSRTNIGFGYPRPASKNIHTTPSLVQRSVTRCFRGSVPLVAVGQVPACFICSTEASLEQHDNDHLVRRSNMTPRTLMQPRS